MTTQKEGDGKFPLDPSKIENIDLVKIDVEGGELNVLEGSLSTIRKFHPILLIEIDFNLSGKDLTQTLSILKSFKYKPYLIEKNELESVDYDEFKSINVNRKYGRHTLNFFLI